MIQLLAFLVGVLLASSASAQGAPDQEVAIKLHMDQLAQIEDVLSRCAMPWTISNALLKTIVAQADQQLKTAEKPPDVKP